VTSPPSSASYASIPAAGGFAPHGAIQTLNLNSSQFTEATRFNARLQPLSITATASGATRLSLVYNYCQDASDVDPQHTCGSNNGNVWKQAIGFPALNGQPVFSEAQTYGYDGFNRLTGVTAASWAEPYGYDTLGNRWVNTRTGLPPLTSETPTASSVFLPSNRITAWNYDEMGNLIGIPSPMSWSFSYDAENRSVQATVNGTTTYAYDGEGRRITKATPGTDPVTNQPTTFTTTYVYDAAGQLAQEYSNAPTVDHGTSYLTADHLGSTRLITDGNSGVKKRFDYLPFGQELLAGTGGRTTDMGYNDGMSVTAVDKQSMKFTAKERDAETGLDYFEARYFSGAQGRFTSPDWSAEPQPVPYADLSDPETLNLYSYIRNNPLSRNDPDGHCCLIFISPETIQRGASFVTGAGKGLVNAYLNEKGTPAALIGSGLRAMGVQPQFASNPAEAAGISAAPYITMGLAMAIPGRGGKSEESLPNEAPVVRGGTNTPESFAKGSGVTIDASGKVQGVSVQSAAGKSVIELSQGLVHNQVGVTTVGQVREAGGNVLPSGTTGNPNHCTMCGVTPQKASELMKVIPNPAKKLPATP
jgi:RHS repeat-associated protein